jgi:cytochrome c553
MKKSLSVIALMGLLACGAMADGAALYKACEKCHGPQGEKEALGGKSQVINQMSRADFIAALKGYQAGTYGGKTKSLMTAPVKGMTEAQMQQIADHILPQ